jgi:pimeloyl-ACP methyl ester carboxylesterase
LNARKAPLLILHGSYMSADAMAPLIRSFAATRTVIATDARGHGRNGDVPGPLTYELLADDAAGVLKALNVAKADVLGYSMGANTALLMAIRHPDRVGKPSAGLARGSDPRDRRDDHDRHRTADGVEMEHALKLFKLRGGGDLGMTTEGHVAASGKARKTAISPTRRENYAGWYQQVVRGADLAEPARC